MGDNNSTDYVWHAKTNRSFNARCHLETGNTSLGFKFASDAGTIDRPDEVQGNPIFIVSDGGKKLLVRGAVTIPGPNAEQRGTITFTPQDDGITEWHWTFTREGETYTEEGRGMFQPDEPKPATRRPAKKPAARKRTPVKKLGSRKVARKKTPASKTKPAKKPAAKKKQSSAKMKQPRTRRSKR
jgi:hypothetical protein